MILLKMLFFSFFLYFNPKIKASGDYAMPSPSEYELFACTKDPMTFIVEVKIHSQTNVAEAIQAVNNYGSEEKFGIKASMYNYFGRIIDELNLMLLKYKVQIHINLDAPVVEEFMTDMNFDPSCELTDPVIERTAAAYDLLKSKYKNSVGLHLFTWSCPRTDETHAQQQKLDNDNCGRVMGLLWKGTAENKIATKSQIMFALTGIERDYSLPESFNADIQANLCYFVNKCLARNATDIGQKVYELEYLRYTDDNIYEE